MAENKEITTLHPYMNRNKNRYPNVREENIPDTIQRKLTAGTGISISPENVISATGGDSYTRSETDALLDTKADKVALENVNKAVPTDIAVKNGKLGLEHDTTWLTNQNAITLGDGLTYDEATKTLKASGGGKLPAGTEADPFKIGVPNSNYYTELFVPSSQNIVFKSKYDMYLVFETGGTSANVTLRGKGTSHSTTIEFRGSDYSNIEYRGWINDFDDYQYICILSSEAPKGLVYYNKETTNHYAVLSVPKNKTESYYLDGTYDATSGTSEIKWKPLKKTYNHYIVINDTTTANAIYLLIPSTNNIKCNSLTDLDTLLGTAQRFIQASGVVTNNASKLPIVALNWQGSIATSKILTMSSEEALTKFTNVVDVVELA